MDIIQYDSIFNNLSIGNYQLYIIDSSNCNSDTLSAIINQPDSLLINYNYIIPATSVVLLMELFQLM